MKYILMILLAVAVGVGAGAVHSNLIENSPQTAVPESSLEVREEKDEVELNERNPVPEEQLPITEQESPVKELVSEEIDNTGTVLPETISDGDLENLSVLDFIAQYGVTLYSEADIEGYITRFGENLGMTKKEIFEMILAEMESINNPEYVEEMFKGNIEFSVTTSINQETEKEELVVRVKTTNDYNCDNYTIDSETTLQNGVLTFNFGGVYLPGAWCLTALGPASAGYGPTGLDSIKTIIFNSNGRTDTYQVTLKNSEISISSISNSFSGAERNSVPLIAKNVIEASCFYNSTWVYDPLDDHCEKYFDEIGAIAQILSEPKKGMTPKSLFYTYSGDYKKLLTVVEKYERDGHYLLINTWDQKIISCLGECAIKPYSYGPNPNQEIEYLNQPIMSFDECDGADDYGCISTVAFYTADPELCEQLPESYNNKNSCFGNVGISSLDPVQCSKTKECMSCYLQCAQGIGRMSDTPAICEEFSTLPKGRPEDKRDYREECIGSYNEYH